MVVALQALLHRAVSGKPLGILKYAMTLDGKIATSTGHSAWVTSPTSRARVFETRARSDAVIVGGQTVRRDNPRLTTRQESGHAPVRIVMSRTLDLPPVRASPHASALQSSPLLQHLCTYVAFRHHAQELRTKKVLQHRVHLE